MIQVLATSQLTSRPLATHSRTNLRTALVFCQGIGRSKVIYSFGRFLSCNFGSRFLISQVQARSTDRCGCGPASMSGNNPVTKLIHSGLNTFRSHSGRALSQTVFFVFSSFRVSLQSRKHETTKARQAATTLMV